LGDGLIIAQMWQRAIDSNQEQNDPYEKKWQQNHRRALEVVDWHH